MLGFTGPLLAPLLRVRWLAPLRVFAHPLVALPAWMISFYVWHLPALYQAALRHDLVHGLQHACFLAFGIAVWMALLGPLPKPAWFTNAARLIYIIVVRLAGTVLANVLIFSGTVLYPIYRAGDAKWHISPMGDQIAAAGVMMVEESLLTIGLFCWLFLKVAREAEERQRLLDAAAARGVELDERRAARAVAAGRGQELWERLTAGGSEPAGATPTRRRPAPATAPPGVPARSGTPEAGRSPSPAAVEPRRGPSAAGAEPHRGPSARRGPAPTAAQRPRQSAPRRGPRRRGRVPIWWPSRGTRRGPGSASG